MCARDVRIKKKTKIFTMNPKHLHNNLNDGIFRSSDSVGYDY